MSDITKKNLVTNLKKNKLSAVAANSRADFNSL